MEEFDKRLSVAETKIDNITKELDELSDIKSVIVELSLLSKQQVEYNKKSTDTYESLVMSNTRFAITLENINKNLMCVNDEIKHTNSRISTLETSMLSDNKDLSESISDIENKSKVDLLELAKPVIPSLIAGGFFFWLLQILGLIQL